MFSSCSQISCHKGYSSKSILNRVATCVTSIQNITVRDWHRCTIPSTRMGIPSLGRGQGTFSPPSQYPYPKHGYRQVCFPFSFLFIFIFIANFNFLFCSQVTALPCPSRLHAPHLPVSTLPNMPGCLCCLHHFHLAPSCPCPIPSSFAFVSLRLCLATLPYPCTHTPCVAVPLTVPLEVCFFFSLSFFLFC
jgi:hypothetical protein